MPAELTQREHAHFRLRRAELACMGAAPVLQLECDEWLLSRSMQLQAEAWHRC